MEEDMVYDARAQMSRMARDPANGRATQRPMAKVRPAPRPPAGEMAQRRSEAPQPEIGRISEEAPWESPIPLTQLPEVECFPVNALPRRLNSFVEEVAHALSCPPDFAATSLLAVAGAAIGASRALQIKEGWKERPCLYLALVGSPGTAKTQAIEAVASPVYAEQARRYADYRLRVKAWKNAGRAGDPPELDSVFVSDVTTEKLASILQNNPRGVALIRDELSGWVSGMDQYRAKGRGSDRQFFLSAWSGTSFRYDRVNKDESLIIPHPFVSVLGGIPPDLLNRLRGHRQIWDGFVDRILFAYPRPFPAREETWASVSDDAGQQWAKVLANLWSLHMEPTAEQDVRPQFIRFTSDGRDEWVQFTRIIAQEQNREDLADAMKGHLPKFRSYGARLALIIHCLRMACGEPQGSGVDGDSMSRAAALVEYFLSHAKKIHAAIDADPRVTLARRVESWIRRERRKRFTRREAHNALQGTFKVVDDLEPILLMLQEHGLIRPEPIEAKPGPGRRASPGFQVHPHLLETSTEYMQFTEITRRGNSVDSVDSVDAYGGREPGEEG
jgi:hypothetical protein